MALVHLFRDIQEQYREDQDADGNSYQTLIGHTYTDKFFNTQTEADELGQEQETGPADPPAPFELADGAEVHSICAPKTIYFNTPNGNQYTRWVWTYDQAQHGTAFPEATPNSDLCGYSARVCALATPTVAVSSGGTVATITATGAVGNLRYSRNAGVSTQVSNVFSGLTPGATYTVRVIDDGVTDCYRDVTFQATESGTGGNTGGGGTGGGGSTGGGTGTPPPANAPTESVSLSLALRPVYETVTAAASQLVQLEIWMETRHYLRDYQLVDTLQKRADALGAVAFDLSRQLSSRLAPEPIDLQALDSFQAGQVAKNYYCRWRTVTAAGVASAWTSLPLRTALLSGLAPTAGWLTTQPATKHVQPAQAEFLFLLTPATATHVVIRRTVQTADLPAAGSEETILCSPRQVLAIPVFNAALPPDAEILTVTAVDDDEQELAPARRYYLTIQPEPQQQQFLWFNSVGGIDTLLTTGAAQTQLEAKPEVASRGSWYNQGPQYALRTVSDVAETRTRRVATGWLTPLQIKWLQTFVLSRWHWLLAGTTLEPLVITKRSISYDRTDPRTEGLTFEYELASLAANWNELRP